MKILNSFKTYLQRENRNYRRELENWHNEVRIEEFKMMAADRL